MDKLQKIAMAYQNIMQIQYYFEIAKNRSTINLLYFLKKVIFSFS